MKNMRLYITVILCLMFAALLATAVVSADKRTEQDVVISEGSFESEYIMLLDKDDEIDVSVTVDSPSGGLVDVYMLSSSEYFDYPDDTFSPALSREGVTTTTFTFTVPADGSYYLIIDNMNNSRPSDAIPTGSVTVDYEYDDPLYTDLGNIEEAAEAVAFTCIAMIVVGIVIVIVIIVVIVYFVTKKEKPPQYPTQYQPPPQQPPYQQYPQQPQQPYQPPPQQPPQQPPPGQQPP